METKIKVETHTGELEGWDWLFTHTENGIVLNDEKTIKEALKEYGKEFGEKFILDLHKSLQYLSDTIIEYVEMDLTDVWMRLDKLENRIEDARNN